MKRVSIIVLAVMFLFAAVGSVIFVHQWLSVSKGSNLQSVDNMQAVYREMLCLQSQNWCLWGNKFRDVIVKATGDSHSSLRDYIHGQTLVFYFDRTMCGPCIDKAADNVRNMISACPDLEVVVLASGFPGMGVFNNPVIKKLKATVLLCSEAVIMERPYSVLAPVIALVDPDLNVIVGYHEPKNSNDLHALFQLQLKARYIGE